VNVTSSFLLLQELQEVSADTQMGESSTKFSSMKSGEIKIRIKSS
jgi:hypothetical protein